MNLEKRIPAGEILTDDEIEMAAGGCSDCYPDPNHKNVYVSEGFEDVLNAPYTEDICTKCGVKGRIPTLSWTQGMCIGCIKMCLF